LTLRAEQLREAFVDSFFPPCCVGCGKPGCFLCGSCTRKLSRISLPICSKCGKPESTGALCPSCWGWQSQIDGLRSPFRFDGVMRHAIHQLKYRNLKSIAVYLARLLSDYLKFNPVPGEVILPVPLHNQRLKQRGYNQSALIARELGKLMELPVIEGCLLRLKDNPPQARTETVDDRHRNVVDAFACIDQRLNGKRILLVDDVCTSGATLESGAAALKSAGAISVWGLALAREI
jgi:ComF family protein